MTYGFREIQLFESNAKFAKRRNYTMSENTDKTCLKMLWLFRDKNTAEGDTAQQKIPQAVFCLPVEICTCIAISDT
jgi:hypothetical protein